MTKYVFKFNELAEIESSQIESEFKRLQDWLHETEIDPDFDPQDHIYFDSETGDRWIFLPELSNAQMFTMELILSSSKVERDDRPMRRSPPKEIEDFDTSLIEDED